MKKIWMGFCFFVWATLSGCNGANAGAGVSAVPTYADLGVCTSLLEGQVRTVAENHTAYRCQSGSWVSTGSSQGSSQGSSGNGSGSDYLLGGTVVSCRVMSDNPLVIKISKSGETITSTSRISDGYLIQEVEFNKNVAREVCSNNIQRLRSFFDVSCSGNTIQAVSKGYYGTSVYKAIFELLIQDCENVDGVSYESGDAVDFLEGLLWCSREGKTRTEVVNGMEITAICKNGGWEIRKVTR